jgi:deoxyribodipyrimidine photo-lyase
MLAVQPPKTSIVWFKRDLRLYDHAPLMSAMRCSDFIIPLYVCEHEYWRLPDTSWRHWGFIRHSLLDLKQSLLAKGADLIFRQGDIIPILKSLIKTYAIKNIYAHEETGNHWTYQRDLRVQEFCRQNSVQLIEYPANAVIRRLKDRNSWSAQRTQIMNQDCKVEPERISLPPNIQNEPIPHIVRDLEVLPKGATYQEGGRQNGLKICESFFSSRSRKYLATLSRPGVSARHCSRLSAHIAYGTLSVREIEKKLSHSVSKLDLDHPDQSSHARNIQAFGSRLAWRCHFVQKLEQQPSIEFQCMNPVFEGMREEYHNPEYFEAWKTGQTGYPLIDACMRSLIENGWITFRMRALLVSFASYHLWLDWRKTAPYMAQLFTDYEPGIHYSQFQMQSGVTGINAVRIYNPIKQSYDHDDQGFFIKRYVPELKEVSPIWIHEPWKNNHTTKYPPPIVDHDQAVAQARARLADRWKDPNFRVESQKVFEKLGSRNKVGRNTIKTQAAKSKQTHGGRQLGLFENN